MAVSTLNVTPSTGFRLNTAPPSFDPRREFPEGFLNFLAPLHKRFTPWQQELLSRRRQVLQAAHNGQLPTHLHSSDATKSSWRIELPDWCLDQRNQMTGPADDAEAICELGPGDPFELLDDTLGWAWGYAGETRRVGYLRSEALG